MEPGRGNLHSQQHCFQEQFIHGSYYSSLLSDHSSEYKVSDNILHDHQDDYSSNSRTAAFFLESWPVLGRASMSSSSTSLDGLSFCDATQQYNYSENNHDLLLAKIKDELPDSFPKLQEIIYSPDPPPPRARPDDDDDQYYSSQDNGNDHWVDINSTNNFSSTTVPHIIELQLSAGDYNLYSSRSSTPPSSRLYQGLDSILPRMKMISTSDLCSSLVSSSLDLNLQASSSTQYSSGNGTLSYHNIKTVLQDRTPSNSSNNKTKSASENGGGRRNRSCMSSETTCSDSKYIHADAKKLRPTKSSRPSCPPLKVRKEKLGDRIAGLQRLVAPYGKTDTASVLTEAIGYIQFLHDQVQTLSVPYMGSAGSKSSRTMLQVNSREMKDVQPKRDLRSRGLCLVPLSFASCFDTFNL